MTRLLAPEAPSTADAPTDPAAPARPAAPPVAGDDPPPLPPPAPSGGGPDPGPRHRTGWRIAAAGGAIVLAAGAFAAGVGVGRSGSADAPAADASVATGADAPPDAATSTAGGLVSVHGIVVSVRPSIVAIHTTVTQTDIFGRQLEGQAAGSGFVLSADGYIVTNDHVVDGAAEITVSFDDGTTADAELVAADPRADLAVLHVDRDDLVPIALGDSDAIQVGDPVVAIGNALDLGDEPTVTSGLVSAIDREITEPNGQVLVHLIQTDAAISPGNSGGPLLDAAGRVVGINTAVAGQGQNIGFAIAINPASELIEQLRTGEVPRHALLGVSTRAGDDGGAQVMAVEPGSAAEVAGIRVDDVIVEVGGDEIGDPSDLVAAIARHRPGEEITVAVRRGDRSMEFDVVLGAHDEVGS